MTEKSDLELVREFQNGQEAAFNRLVLRYQERIYWLARKFVNDHDHADDIVQEVFCKTYEALRGFRGESSYFTWLYRITVNISLNYVRRQRIKDFLRIDEMFDTEGDRAEEPDVLLEKKEQRELIEEAIAQLPEKQKAVFLLRYYEELPYEDIAKILKTSVGGLKANYFHAVRKIGNYLTRAHGTR
ncbi:MAG TPA: sigma-70 family RNA polymerase sigma factor [Bacteroidota bacterium]|nr:sigma-70 family RNA polymerase sigma factor [Bacteroidota bacterium]